MAGFPGYDASFLLVLMAPRGTPAPIVAAMNQAMVEALKSPEVVEKLKATDQRVVATRRRRPLRGWPGCRTSGARWSGSSVCLSTEQRIYLAARPG